MNTRKILLLVTLILLVLSAYQMFSLPLWGHWPLVLFASTWAFWLSWRAPSYSALPNNYRWIWLSSLSGVLLSLGFPVSPLTPLMFVGFVPLLILERELAADSGGLNKRLLLKYAYNTFVIWNILTTYWVANTAFVAGIIANLLNAFFMCVPFLAFHQARLRLGERWGYTAFIVFWMSFEMLHLRWEISWPWLTLGNSFALYPTWVQWYEYTGALGGSLWILLANVLIVPVVYNNTSAMARWRDIKLISLNAWSWPVSVIILPIIVSLLIYNNVNIKGQKSINVVAVQPNYEPHYNKFNIAEDERLRNFLTLSASKVSAQTDYLVFPETSFEGVELSRMQQSQLIAELQQFMRPFPTLQLVTGVDSYKIFNSNENHDTPNIREEEKGSHSIYWEAYNGALQISSDTSAPVLHYKKSKFVPGAEILPYKNFFFFLEPLIKKLGGTMSGMGSQAERDAFKSKQAAVAPVICYESVYGDYLGDYVRNGAQAIFVITNDGWWDNTPGHQQHKYFSSLRAIETRRDVVRSANSGISCFINQRGDIRNESHYDEATAIADTMQLNNNITLYVRFGDVLGWLAVCLCAGLLGWLVIKRFQ